MLLKQNIFKTSHFKVMELIFKYPNQSFHLRGIAKQTKLSTTAVKKAVNELEKSQIIKYTKDLITTNIKADLDSQSYFAYKRLFNLYQFERLKITQKLIETYNPKNITLFGSYSKGEDIEQSDIDILIITNNPNKNINQFLKNIEKQLNRNINLHILQSLQRSSTEFKNSAANGIVLHGYLNAV